LAPSNFVTGDITVDDIRVDVDLNGSGLVPDSGIGIDADAAAFDGNYALEPAAADPTLVDVNQLGALAVGFTGFVTSFEGICNVPIIGHSTRVTHGPGRAGTPRSDTPHPCRRARPSPGARRPPSVQGSDAGCLGSRRAEPAGSQGFLIRTTSPMATIRDVEWLPPLLEQHRDPARVARIKARAGRVQGTIGYFMASDWVPEAAAELNVALFTRTHLDHDLADLVGLAVSQGNSCRYCFAATRTLLLMVGYPRERIARLEQNLAGADLDARTRGAIAFAHRLSRCDPHPSAADVDALRHVGIQGAAYRELVAAIGLWVFFNRTSTLAALPPEFMEALPDRWFVKAFRPFVAGRVNRAFRRRGQPVALPASMRDGPSAATVNALDGLPVAPTLRRAIDAMWASGGLSRRSRAFVCTTIARALQCTTAEAEAAAVLAHEGVEAITLEGMLAHLDAPGLTDAERVLVRFARETVWYEPAPVQRRAAEVRARLGEREFVEAIATASIANMLCRLHLALVVV